MTRLSFFLIVASMFFHGLADAKTITCFYDGARIDYEAVSTKGYLEIPLSPGFLPNSLHIKPLTNCVISRVDIVPATREAKYARDVKVLTKRKNFLKDRLAALDAREEIFKGAAKSQSGRAPRKTKNNPEPMSAIRQGTSFAIAQLDSVYVMRRKTENELASVDSRLTQLEKSKAPAGSTGRVWLSRKGARVHVSYYVSDKSWTPFYEFRLAGNGCLNLLMRAHLPATESFAKFAVVPAKMSDITGTVPSSLPILDKFHTIGDYKFTVENEQFSPGPVAYLSFAFKNSTNFRFAAGEAALFRKGEFVGNSHFAGTGPNASASLVCGKQNGNEVGR